MKTQDQDINLESESVNNERLPESAPYSRTPEEIRAMVGEIQRDPSCRYIDSSTNPDIGSLSIYKVKSSDRRADVGRTFEAQVFSQDAGYEIDFIAENFSPYDGNSEFLILVDEGLEEPQLAGVLRATNASQGPSETISFYKEFYGEDLPAELSIENPKGWVWDIMTVAVTPQYRDGINSAWLYHALYRRSLEEGVDRWISNITPKEIRNLRDRLGIPFKDVPGVKPVFDKTPDGSEAEYGFYYARVEELGPAVVQHINNLEHIQEDEDAPERQKRLSLVLAQISKIARYGATNTPNEPQAAKNSTATTE